MVLHDTCSAGYGNCVVNCVSVADVSAVADLPNLQHLNLSDSKDMVTDKLLQQLSTGCRSLTALDVSGCPAVTDAGLVHIARLPQLLSLNASCYSPHVTGAGLDAARHLKRLSLSRKSPPACLMLHVASYKSHADDRASCCRHHAC